MKNTSHFATVVNVKDRRLSPEDREEFRKIYSLQGGIFSGKNATQRQRMTSGFRAMLPKGCAMSSSGGNGLTTRQKRQLRQRQRKAKKVV